MFLSGEKRVVLEEVEEVEVEGVGGREGVGSC